MGALAPLNPFRTLRGSSLRAGRSIRQRQIGRFRLIARGSLPRDFFKHFFAVNFDVGGGVDAEPRLTPTRICDHDLDVWSDHDGLSDVSL